MTELDHGNFDIAVHVSRTALGALATSPVQTVVHTLTSSLFEKPAAFRVQSAVTVEPPTVDASGALTAKVVLKAPELQPPELIIFGQTIRYPKLAVGDLELVAQVTPIIRDHDVRLEFKLSSRGLDERLIRFEAALLAMATIAAEAMRRRGASAQETDGLLAKLQKDYDATVGELANKLTAPLLANIVLAKFPTATDSRAQVRRSGALAVLARPDSISLLANLPGGFAGKTANTKLIKRTRLAAKDVATVIVSNACLLGDVVRPVIAKIPNLDPSGFAADHPLRWDGDLQLLDAGGIRVRLRAVRAGVDDQGNLTLRLTLGGRHDKVPVGLETTLNVAVGVKVEVGRVVVTLPNDFVRELKVDIDDGWEVATTAGAFFDPTGTAAGLLATFHIAKAVAQNELPRLINEKLRELLKLNDHIEFPLPVGKTFTLTTENTQPDAPRGVDDFAQHDSVVHLSTASTR